MREERAGVRTGRGGMRLRDERWRRSRDGRWARERASEQGENRWRKRAGDDQEVEGSLGETGSRRAKEGRCR